MTWKIDLNQATLALTDALDLVGVDSFQHGKRVGFMAAAGWDRLPLQPISQNELLQLGMLHDVGVSSSRMHVNLVVNFQWEGEATHCQVGHDLLKQFPPFAKLAPYVLYHHSPLDRLVGLPDEVALIANWIYLVDRADTLAALRGKNDILEMSDEILDRLASKSGDCFFPELVRLFGQLTGSQSFWLQQLPQHLNRYFHALELEANPVEVSFEEVRSLAKVFSQVVDAKSPFTQEHSLGVASLSVLIGKSFGLPQDQLEKLEIAGLLHDLGKLKVPDEVLDKAGPLNAHERALMTHHSFDTFQILSRIIGMEEIAQWAAFHHESPQGQGYPFHLHGRDLSLEAKIIAVCDVFHALVQARPYRDSLPAPKVAEILRKMEAEGKLDGGLVEWVHANLDRCYETAKTFSGATNGPK